jgi:carbon storage regulator
MLVITVEVGQTIKIGDDVMVTIVKSGSKQVKVGIEAPLSLAISRGELIKEPKNKQK